MAPAPRWSVARSLILIGVVMMVGCATAPPTVWRGTYTRTWVDETGETRQLSGAVSLALHEGGAYQLTGESPEIPPPGSGLYRRSGDTIDLEDTAPARAGFDLGLLISGTFEAAEENDRMVLTQTNTWGHSHLFILTRDLR